VKNFSLENTHSWKRKLFVEAEEHQEDTSAFRTELVGCSMVAETQFTLEHP